MNKRTFRTLDDVDCANKRVLLRGDLNVPVENGVPSDTTRIGRLLPTIKELVSKKARVVVLSHFGRPKSKDDLSMSLEPVAQVLGSLLNMKVQFCADTVGPNAEAAVAAMKPGEILVLENTRFQKGEEANDPDFVKALAKLGDVFVNDAFSVAHRAHASTEGLAHLLPSCAGRDMEEELRALSAALNHPEKPLMAIVGGSKISTKIDVLQNLVKTVDVLVLGGGMANTFLAAKGVSLGKSLYEKDMLDTARAIMQESSKSGCRILLPRDVVVADKLDIGVPSHNALSTAIPQDKMALDIGPIAADEISNLIGTMKTVVWNGPLGAFEYKPFDQGTIAVAKAIAAATKAGKILSVAGGGDTVAAVNIAGVADDLSYVSGAGGAFLEWLEGRVLPGVEVLRIAPIKGHTASAH